jgi:hypothetical protein
VLTISGASDGLGVLIIAAIVTAQGMAILKGAILYDYRVASCGIQGDVIDF